MPPEHHNTRNAAPDDDAHLNPRQKLERSRQALHRAMYPESYTDQRTGSVPTRFMSDSPKSPAQNGDGRSEAASSTHAANALLQSSAQEGVLSLLGKLLVATSPGHTARQINDVLAKVAAVAGSVIARRWQHHPAHVALQVSQPLLQNTARKRPFQLLAGAAALGALVVLARPWRMQGSRRVMRAGLADELRILGVTGLMYLLTPSRRKR